LNVGTARSRPTRTHYHIVDRRSPDGGDYHDLCRYTLGLTGFDVREAWKGYHASTQADREG
jgi:hypothetical protein